MLPGGVLSRTGERQDVTDLLTLLDASGVDDQTRQTIASLARDNTEALGSFLVTIGGPLEHTDTKTLVRTHFVRKDPNGRPRVDDLVGWLADQVVDYCVPRSRINEAFQRAGQTGSAAPLTQLANEARELFTPLTTSGEGGELLLFIMLETVLGAPQLLTKMSLKTSTKMHVHGSDGIHAKLLDNNNLALYWGESKLHATAKSAIDDCFESVAPYLTGGFGGAAKTDLLLVRDRLDAGSKQLTALLVKYFEKGTFQSGMVEVRAGCLVGFTLDNYPDPHDSSSGAVVEEVQLAVEEWHTRINERVKHHSLASFEIEVFCVPVPSVDDFRGALRARLGLA